MRLRPSTMVRIAVYDMRQLDSSVCRECLSRFSLWEKGRERGRSWSGTLKALSPTLPKGEGVRTKPRFVELHLRLTRTQNLNRSIRSD